MLRRPRAPATGSPSLGCGAGTGFGEGLPVGFGVHLDFAGDDVYTTGHLALGSGTHGGFGACVDFRGADRYISKGLGLGASRDDGRGVMLDVFGKDHYFVTEGLGVALGTSMAWFTDRSGDDIYEVFAAGMGFASRGAAGVFQDLGGRNRFRTKAQAPRFLPGLVADGGLAVFRSRGIGHGFVPPRSDPARWTPARLARERARGRVFLTR